MTPETSNRPTSFDVERPLPRCSAVLLRSGVGGGLVVDLGVDTALEQAAVVVGAHLDGPFVVL
jgi:hypothetical protein